MAWGLVPPSLTIAAYSHMRIASNGLSLACLQVCGEQGSVPVICYEDQVVIPIHCSPTLDMPHSFERCFAQQGASESDVLSIAPIDVMGIAMKSGVVHKYPVHPVYVTVEEAYLQRAGIFHRRNPARPKREH